MRVRPELLIAALCLAAAPTTRPATTAPSVDQRIDQLLAPPPPVVRRPTPVRGMTGRVIPYVREGTTVIDLPGHLGHTADRRAAVFTFTADGDGLVYPPMIVLPNLELDAMERQQSAAMAAGGDAGLFRVSGWVTEYKGRNYLRLDRATSEPDDRSLPRAAGRRTDLASGPAAVAPAAVTVPLLRDGTHLPTRTGRLNVSPDGSQAELTFDTDGRAMRDPPMIILPNLKLANMEGQRNGLSKDFKFRVSGTVTEYHGRNYILLDKCVASQDYDSDF